MAGHVLVTGGAGYIGSHTCLALLEAGYRVTVVDNLSNSSSEAVRRVGELSGRPTAIDLEVADLLDGQALEAILAARSVEAVIHFAGLKAVGESVAEPLRYWHNNVSGSLILFQAMAAAGIRRLVFSSSATVYGAAEQVPVPESAPLGATNPYGRTKLAIEEILRDLAAADAGSAVALLRYFNPVGAHPSGRIGEDPKGIPNNLMPFVMQVAVGRRPEVNVFGDDYPTPDGTGVRDYVHVMDLAEGHVAALQALERQPSLVTANLGTGRGYSVMEVIKAASGAVGRQLPYRVSARRPGDVARLVADPSRAAEQLGWRARRGLDEMCADHWRWQEKNPEGYPD
jgi:UDP-glucose 4-epimerase